jgi:hypothetical protein
MNTSLRTRITTATTLAVGAGAIALGALAVGAPAANAQVFNPQAFQQSCEQHPELYADGATRGVYYTRQYNVDREHICDAYDADGKLLGRTISVEYGWYIKHPPVDRATTPPVIKK